jgi:hypothetical protein
VCSDGKGVSVNCSCACRWCRNKEGDALAMTCQVLLLQTQCPCTFSPDQLLQYCNPSPLTKQQHHQQQQCNAVLTWQKSPRPLMRFSWNSSGRMSLIFGAFTCSSSSSNSGGSNEQALQACTPPIECAVTATAVVAAGAAECNVDMPACVRTHATHCKGRLNIPTATVLTVCCAPC